MENKKKTEQLNYNQFRIKFADNLQKRYPKNPITDLVYFSSNEHLNDYFEDINFVNKKVATVGSSGDQLLNAIYYGSKDITLIDACILAQPYIEYKIALIKAFDFQTFRNIYINKGSIFDWKVYSKISSYLSPIVQQFFDEIFLEQDVHAKFTDDDFFDYLTEFKIKRAFVGPSNRHLSKFYNNEESFLKLKNILLTDNVNINYQIAHFEDFSAILKTKYDVIILSNIRDHVPRLTFLKGINKLYSKNLNPGGTIQYQYTFMGTPDKSKHPTKLEKRKLKEQFLPKDESKRKFFHIAKVYLLEKPKTAPEYESQMQ